MVVAVILSFLNLTLLVAAIAIAHTVIESEQLQRRIIVTTLDNQQAAHRRLQQTIDRIQTQVDHHRRIHHLNIAALHRAIGRRTTPIPPPPYQGE